MNKIRFLNNLLIASLLFISVSCEKNEDFKQFNQHDTGVLRTGKMVKLGKKLDNPYSVKNMRSAYAELVKEGKIKPEKFNELEIETTHLYIRFLPSDAQEFLMLEDMLELMLFDHSLLHEIEEEGDFYHDPEIPESYITWQYTVVAENFVLPRVRYEIIDECFIPYEFDLVYDELSDKSGKAFIARQIEERALLNAGYFDLMKSKGLDEGNGEKLDLTLQQPKGMISLIDPNRVGQVVGAKGITVRCWLGVKIGRGVTDSLGNYAVDAMFRLGPYYRLYYYRGKDWSMKNNLVSFSVSKNYGLGYHDKRGYSRTITQSESAHPFCIISNAAFDYYKWCEENSILKPPSELRIWVATYLGCSAPMMSKVYGPLTVYGNVNSGSVVGDGWWDFGKSILNTTLANQASVLSFFLGLRPDITLTNSTNTNLYRSTIHELSHASHMRQVGSEYWAKYVSYILTQYVNGADTYGSQGSFNSGYCGVGEMWGYYIGGMLATQNLPGSWWDGNDYWFVHRILRQLGRNAETRFPRLNNPLTEKQIYDCLTSDITNHNQLRNRLIQKYGREQEINAVFAAFGF
jgi:hypothetical protein